MHKICIDAFFYCLSRVGESGLGESEAFDGAFLGAPEKKVSITWRVSVLM